MRQLILTAIVMAAGTSFAETPALYDCIYEYRMEGKGEKGNISRVFNCILQIGEEQSRFSDYAAFRLDSVKQMKGVDEGTIMKFQSELFKEENYFDQLVFNSVPKAKFTVSADMVPDRYCYEEKAPAMEWTMQEGTETVCGYECRKASAEYGGRQWTVWYAEEIPVPFGPWKLAGLPGLVLKAEDSEGNHRFTATTFREATGEIVPDGTPNMIKTSHEKFVERKNLYDKDFKMSMLQPEQIREMRVIDKKIIINGMKTHYNCGEFIPLEFTVPRP